MWHTLATVTSLPWTVCPGTVSQNKPYTLYPVCRQHFITTAERYWGRGIVLTTLILSGPGGYLMTKSEALPSFPDFGDSGHPGNDRSNWSKAEAGLSLASPSWMTGPQVAASLMSQDTRSVCVVFVDLESRVPGSPLQCVRYRVPPSFLASLCSSLLLSLWMWRHLFNTVEKTARVPFHEHRGDCDRRPLSLTLWNLSWKGFELDLWADAFFQTFEWMHNYSWRRNQLTN